jgi:hypothetical protein
VLHILSQSGENLKYLSSKSAKACKIQILLMFHHIIGNYIISLSCTKKILSVHVKKSNFIMAVYWQSNMVGNINTLQIQNYDMWTKINK